MDDELKSYLTDAEKSALERCDAASQEWAAEWDWQDFPIGGGVDDKFVVYMVGPTTVVDALEYTSSENQAIRDAKFASSARYDLPEALETIAKLRKELRQREKETD